MKIRRVPAARLDARPAKHDRSKGRAGEARPPSTPLSRTLPGRSDGLQGPGQRGRSASLRGAKASTALD